MDGNGNLIPPFAVENGVVKMVNARIAGANIDNLVVAGSQIEPAAVNTVKYFQGSASPTPGQTVIDVIVDHGARIAPNIPIVMRLEFYATGQTTGNFLIQGPLTLVDVQSGVTLYSMPNAAVGQSGSPTTHQWHRLYTVPVDRPSTTIRLTLPNNNVTNWTYLEVVAMAFRNNAA